MPGSVVIVHDEHSFLLESAVALGDAGHSLATFTDPMAALKAVEEIKPPDILITRVTFPEGSPNGIALARMLRLKCPNLKVIFAARAQWEEYTQAVGELLPHPVDLRQLVETVTRLVTESQRVSS
jgi:DNA-binding NtrC family response regulator